MGKMRTLDEIVAIVQEQHGVNYEYEGFGPKQWVEKTVIYTCPTHGKKVQRISQHIKTGCGDCARISTGKLKRETLESFTVKANNIFNGRFTYTELYHTNTGKARIKFICDSHGEQEQPASWHLNSSHGCPDCANKNTPRGFNAYSEATWEARARAQVGDAYLGVVLRESRRYCLFRCSKHGKQEVLISNLEKGVRCISCSYETRGQVKLTEWTPTLELELKGIHNGKFTYLGLGVSQAGKRTVMYICPKHGVAEQSLKDHAYGIGCAKCTNIVSKPSVEVYEYIRTLGVEAEQEIRLSGGKYVWDIVIPRHNLAVEYHGLYWHSTAFQLPSYHANKHKLGLSAGYRTIHIFSDEWATKRSIVESIIRSQLGKDISNSVYARKCTLVDVNYSIASIFLNTYHIQGRCSAKARFLGLSHLGKLVAILGYEFHESGRGQGSSNESCEIVRYATSGKVSGGFSKLLAALETTHSSLKQIYTYSDIRLFTGRLYENCGFRQAYTLSPDYWYTDSKVRMHKSKFQKSRFRDNPHLVYEDGKTELELAKLNRLYRVYDCGKIKWIKSI